MAVRFIAAPQSRLARGPVTDPQLRSLRVYLQERRSGAFGFWSRIADVTVTELAVYNRLANLFDALAESVQALLHTVSLFRNTPQIGSQLRPQLAIIVGIHGRLIPRHTPLKHLKFGTY